jgi:biofilm PGA synthesis N-glycosyltransferase PgaC
MFREQGLRVRHNPRGLLFYLVIYALMMQPMCVWGYAVESLGLQKKWGTK